MKIEANWLQIYSKSCVKRTNFYFYLSCEHWKLCHSVFFIIPIKKSELVDLLKPIKTTNKKI